MEQLGYWNRHLSVGRASLVLLFRIRLFHAFRSGLRRERCPGIAFLSRSWPLQVSIPVEGRRVAILAARSTDGVWSRASRAMDVAKLIWSRMATTVLCHKRALSSKPRRLKGMIMVESPRARPFAWRATPCRCCLCLSQRDARRLRRVGRIVRRVRKAGFI